MLTKLFFMNITGTTHHDLCPTCNNYTIDREDGYCKYANCGGDFEDDEANERNFMREHAKHTALTEDEMLIYGLL